MLTREQMIATLTLMGWEPWSRVEHDTGRLRGVREVVLINMTTGQIVYVALEVVTQRFAVLTPAAMHIHLRIQRRWDDVNYRQLAIAFKSIMEAHHGS